MTKTASIITAVIVVLIVAVGAWLFMRPATAPVDQSGTQQPAGKISAETDQSIRDTVSAFGMHLKNVSLLSTSTLSSQIASEYGPYLSSSLLAQWQANPSLALGREVSSPWPDRIEVSSVTPSGDGVYTVSADVVEVTSTDTATSSTDRYPITMTVAQNGSGYQITNVTH